MKIIIILLGTLFMTLVIISPFFWLRFLYHKDRKLYVFYSTLATVGIFGICVIPIYRFILNYINSYDILYYFDSISTGAIYLNLLIFLISPFIFAKIIYDRINVKSFFISLFISILILAIYIYFFVNILLPRAFEELNRRL